MASKAYAEYLRNLEDVHRLVLLHKQLSGSGRGRRGLGHLTRGGILLLCAAWERYIETVALEGADFLIGRLASYTDLPAGASKRVRDHSNSNGNAWTAADLATPQWKVMFEELIERRINVLNTPKHDEIHPLFSHFFGLTTVESYWAPATRTEIDAFVSLRGEVAHRGRQSQYVHFHQLVKYEEDVSAWVRRTDRGLSDYFRLLVVPNRRPWSRLPV